MSRLARAGLAAALAAALVELAVAVVMLALEVDELHERVEQLEGDRCLVEPCHPAAPALRLVPGGRP